MPTPKKGARLGGSPSHQRKILSNLAASLIEHGAIKTTDTKAKLLRPYIEKLITHAKKGTLASRRQVLRKIPNKAAVRKLFDELAPQFDGRNGGYTRIVKLGNRAGDNAPMSRISLVLEETVSHEAERATRAAASKLKKEEEAGAAESAAPDQGEQTDEAAQGKAEDAAPKEAEAQAESSATAQSATDTQADAK